MEFPPHTPPPIHTNTFQVNTEMFKNKFLKTLGKNESHFITSGLRRIS